MYKLQKTITCFALSLFYFNLQCAIQVISKPGVYVLGSNISFNPASPDNMITIDSNDIVLDLGQNTIMQTNGTPNVNGIIVNSGRSNIIIKNGTIKNLSGTGIKISTGCSKLKIENLQIFNCAISGIECVGTPSSNISTFDIVDCSVAECSQSISATTTVYLEYCSGFRLTNLRVNNNGGTTTSLDAIKIINCSSARIKDVRANSNKASSSMHAFHFANCNDLIVIGCITRGSTSADTSVGYCLESDTNCQNNTFNNCVVFVNNATGLNGTTNGFYIGSNNNNNIFKNCRATLNSSISDCTGFYTVSNTNNIFLKCMAIENNSQNGTARGFYLVNHTEAQLINCMVSRQKSTNFMAIGMDLNNCLDCFLLKCICIQNSGNTDANSYGIKMVPPTPYGNNVLLQNTAVRNGPNTPIENNQLLGLNAQQKSTIQNGCVNQINNSFSNTGIV